MTYTRPDISYATKELARSLTQPTTLDQQKFKDLLRYIRGTQYYRFYVRPSVRTMDATPDLSVFVDSDWAGCAATRKSTSGSVKKFMGSTIHFGSRAQATIALSSAEAELDAINTGATESLFIRNILQEALNTKKVSIGIHTGSSSWKSMATRMGLSKKAKHIDSKPFHSTTGTARSGENHQDQHGQQHRGHLHQVRVDRNAHASSQPC